jgi:Tol biopolymer transport system component
MKKDLNRKIGLVAFLLVSLMLAACGESAATQIPPTVATTTAPAATTTVATTTTTGAIVPTITPTTVAQSTTTAPVTTTPPVTTTATNTATTTAVATTTAPVTTTPPRTALIAYVESGNLNVINPDTKERKTLLEAAKAGETKEIALAEQGSLLVASVLGSNNIASLYVTNTSDPASKLIASQPAATSDTDPQISPDGKLVLFTRVLDSNKDGRYDIKDKHELWLVESNGINARKLTDGQMGAWASDGKRIAFVTDGKLDTTSGMVSDNALKMINVEGKNEWEPINPSKIPTDWSKYGFPFQPDIMFIQHPIFLDNGKLVSFTTQGHSGLIFTINSTDGKDLKLWNTNYEGGFGRVVPAPSGTLLCVEGYPATGVMEFEILNATGQQPMLDARPGTRVGGIRAGFGATNPTWSPDGKRLAFLKTDTQGRDGAIKGTLVITTWNNNAIGSLTELVSGNFGAVAWSK